MQRFLKQSTATTVVLGPFVDDTDAKTAETALTISQADIRLSKNGGTFAQTNNSAGATHMENGYYSVPLDTTDSNTLGHLRVAVNESGALPVWADFMVLAANVYDSLFGNSDKLQVDAVEWSGVATESTDVALATSPSNFAALAITAGGAVTTGSIANDAITAAAIATGAIDADAIADNAIDAGAIAADAITAAKIADGAIDAGAIASGAITSAKFAAGAITASVIATDAIDADALAADAVTEIAAGVGASLSIPDGSLTNAKFADGAIDSRVITTAAAVQAANVASGNVTARRGDTISSLNITTTAHDWDSGKKMRLLLKQQGNYAAIPDTDAYLGILLTQGGDASDGLDILNQVTRTLAGELAEGSLVRSSSTLTLVNIKASAYAQLAPTTYAYELQVAESDGTSVVTIAAGYWTVPADVVRATN